MQTQQTPKKRDAVIKILQTNAPGSDLLKQSEESERVVLGAVLFEESNYHHVADQLQPGDFALLKHGLIWLAIERVMAEGGGLDIITLSGEMQKPDYKYFPASPEALAEYIQEPARTAALLKHVQTIRGIALKIRVMAAADEIKRHATDRTVTPDELVLKADAAMNQATERIYQRPTDMFSIAGMFYDEIESIVSGKSQVMPTGFPAFDNDAGGITKGEVTVLAGGAKMGKTTLMLSIALDAAMRGLRVAIFSLEMTQSEVTRKLLTMLTGIPAKVFKTGDFTPRQSADMVTQIGVLAKMHIDIIDEYQMLSPLQLKRRLAQLTAKADYDLVVVDGLWLMRGDEETRERHVEVGQIMQGLTGIAKDTGLPILLMHQYKQAVDIRKDKTPTIYDLAESAAVQRTGQMILGMYRASYFDRDDGDTDTSLYVLAERSGDGIMGSHYEIPYDQTHQRYWRNPRIEKGFLGE
jgi:replicative DNA helicase